ncbi:unnamed protein product [Soboliphyme baturini]|uniref:Uncharacterized protein n=1 Tax=Soboliphyme baturini TaxID=241478 RepID=A0A183IWA1_9BILA|nr:unnamed protein product [Soboliphyme baturini]
MDFLRRVAGLTHLDMNRNTDIQQSPGEQPLLLQIEKSQLRWLGYVTNASRKEGGNCLLPNLPAEVPEDEQD